MKSYAEYFKKNGMEVVSAKVEKKADGGHEFKIVFVGEPEPSEPEMKFTNDPGPMFM